MGKQAYFYMMNNDEKEFVTFIQSDTEVCIFQDRTTENTIRKLSRLPDRNVSGWFLLWIWNTRTSAQPKLKYIKKQGYYVVDISTSEVIQFSRSYLDHNMLVRGRLWVDSSRLSSTKLTAVPNSSTDFVRWYRKIERWIRKNSIKNDSSEYLLPSAAKFHNEGGVLCQTPLDDSVKIIHHV
jgi:hypothetical protein